MKPYEDVDESLPVGQRFTREVVKRLRESYEYLVRIGDRPPYEYGLVLEGLDVLREERDRLRAALENISWRLSQVLRLRDKSVPWGIVELIRDDAREAALAGEGERVRCNRCLRTYTTEGEGPCWCGGTRHRESERDMTKIEKLRRLYAEATPGRMEYDGERGWVLDESGDVALRSCTWGIGPLAADALSTLPALLDVAEAARRYADDSEDAEAYALLRHALARLEEMGNE